MLDMIVIGGGPAGLTAALYGARAGRQVLVLEKESLGGQIAISPRVENFPAVSAVSGVEFADRLVEQVLAMGAELEFDEAVAIEPLGASYRVKAASGAEWESKTVILATGAKARRLGLPHEEQLIGWGVSYCAVCDGAFYQDKVVAVNGGGDSALQEALFLSDICAKVYLIHRRDTFRGEMTLVRALQQKSNVEFILRSQISALHGEKTLTGIMVTDDQGNHKSLELDGLFVAIGHEPENALFTSLVPMDDAGYANIDEACTVGVSGIFVAGDCRHKSVRQLTTAVGDGAAAATAACQYLDLN